MAIKTECRHCGESYTLADNQRGKTVRCKSCGEPFEVHPVGLQPGAGPEGAEETRVAAAPSIRRRPGHDLDEDERDSRRGKDRDEEERGKVRRRRPRDDDDDEPAPSSGGGTLRVLIAGGAVMALLCFGCVAALGIWAFRSTARRGPTTPPPVVTPRPNPFPAPMPAPNPPVFPPPGVQPPVGQPPVGQPPVFQPPEPQPPVFQPRPPRGGLEDNPNITRANFDRLRVGMTPEEAVEILGEPTRKTGSTNTLQSYYWTAPGKLILLRFRKGALSSKSGTNLP